MPCLESLSALSKLELLKEQYGQQRGFIAALCNLPAESIVYFPLRMTRVCSWRESCLCPTLDAWRHVVLAVDVTVACLAQRA